MNKKDMIKKNIETHKAKICVIGLGYVGLPLAIEFAKVGFKVYGLDTDKKRLSSLAKGKSYIDDVSSRTLDEIVKKKLLKPVNSYRVVSDCDCIIICVPTPLSKTKEPDISFIINCFNKLLPHLKKHQVIILESTTYPGTTREILAPKLKEAGFKIGKDIYLSFSPERIDPGNEVYTISNIPKIVGGIDKKSAGLTVYLYKQIIEEVIVVSSSDVAETVKLLENTFRSVNIGLANEMQLLCYKLGMDVWEVIKAASTKPYGFMPFYPGPGLGGHCIPVDPVYLSWRAKLSGFEPRLIDIAQQVNAYMPEHVVDRIIEILNRYKKPLNNSRILIVGVSYKKDIKDTRESPALEVISLLDKAAAHIDYYDNYVKSLRVGERILKSKKITKQNLASYDLVCILTAHTNINYQLILKFAKVIFDTRNALGDCKTGKKVFKL